MRTLQDLIEFKNADSALSLRERPYGKGEHAELLCDVIALANATATNPRFLCLGVSDRSAVRTFPGLSQRVWNRQQMLQQIPHQHESADEHFRFETRAHKVNLLVGNLTDVALSDVVLVLKIPRVEGVGLVERIHAAPGERVSAQEHYPVVGTGPRVVTVHAGGISVPGRANVAAFREPLRIYLREPAAGKTIPLTYSLHGRGLRAPIHGTLRIYVTEREPAAGVIPSA
jgi:hypothetical protein